jgi:hypothetical protein
MERSMEKLKEWKGMFAGWIAAHAPQAVAAGFALGLLLGLIVG